MKSNAYVQGCVRFLVRSWSRRCGGGGGGYDSGGGGGGVGLRHGGVPVRLSFNRYFCCVESTLLSSSWR